MILVTQHNPFDPGDRTIERLSAPCTLAELAPKTTQPVILLHQGAPVLRADWPSTQVVEGDVVCAVYLPAGGGGKNPLRAVLMIAVMVASAWAGPAAAGLMGFTQGTTAFAAASASVTSAAALAGSALVNAFLPPPALNSSQRLASAAEASPTYSLQAQGNRARLGSAIPEQFGRVRAYPDFASAPYTTYRGGDQYLYQLLCLGRGTYTVHELYIGNSPASAFADASFTVYGPGERPTAFPDSVVASPDVGSLELERNLWSAGFVTNSPGTDLQAFVVSLVAPGGTYQTPPENPGEIRSVETRREVSWIAIDDDGAEIGGWVTGYDYTSNLTSYQQPHRETHWITVPSGVTRAKVRVRIETTHEGGADFVVDRWVWESLSAQLASPLPEATYPDCTLIAVQMRASRQLSGAASRLVSVDCTRHLPVYAAGVWTEQETRSAAWAFAHVLRSANGAGLADERIDLDQLVALDAAGVEFNGRFDTQIACWEALTQIARVARGRPYQQGGRVRLARDVEQTVPVAMFTDRNILRDSFSLELKPPAEDAAVAVAVSYLDASVWRPRKVAARWDGAEVDPDDALVEVDLFGVTSRDAAFAEAYYLARANKYRRRTVRFATEMEGFIPSPGDLISVSHQMPAWGVSGDVVAWDGGTRTARLSNPPDWSAGPLYIVLRKRDGSQAGPYAISQGATDADAVLAEAPAISPDVDGSRERTHYAVGAENAWNRLALVTSILPRSDHEVKIEACIDDQRAREAPGVDPPDAVAPPPIYDTCTAPAVYGLSVIATAGLDEATASWSADWCATGFDVEITADPADAWERIATEQQEPQIRFPNPYGAALQVRVRAVGDTVGAWSAAATFPESATGTPRAPLDPPTSITATPWMGGASLAWVPNPSPFLGGTRVWVSQTDDLETATEAELVSGSRGSALVLGLPGNTEHFFWLQSVNKGGIGGPASASVSATTLYAIDELEGELDESWLSEELNDRINLIDADGDGLVDTVAGLSADLLQEAQDRVAADAANAQAIADEAAARAAAYAQLEGDIDGLDLSINQLSVSASPNLLTDAVFQDWASSWSFASTDTDFVGDTVRPSDPSEWALANVDDLPTLRVYADPATDVAEAAYAEFRQIGIPVEPAQRYQWSCWTGAHRCRAVLWVCWFDDAGELLSCSASSDNDEQAPGGSALEDFARIAGFGTAPAGAATADLYLRVVLKTGAPTPNSIYAFFVRPHFGLATESQTEPSSWTPGIPLNAAAMVQDVQAALVSEDEALADDITSLSATVEGKASANIIDVNTVRLRWGADGQVDLSSAQHATALESDIAGKADAAAVSALETRVTDNEGGIAALSSAVTALDTQVDGKAEASALQSLETRVTSNENGITALSSSVSDLEATVGGGANLVLDATFSTEPKTAAESPLAWVFYTSAGYTLGWPASGDDGWALRSDDAEHTVILYKDPQGATGLGRVHTAQLIGIAAGQRYCASVYANPGGSSEVFVSLGFFTDVGAFIAAIESPSATTAVSGDTLDTFERISVFGVAPPNACYARVYCNVRATGQDEGALAWGRFVRPMLCTAGEEQAQPPPWQLGGEAVTARVTELQQAIASGDEALAQNLLALSTELDGKATASAVTALETRVTDTETGLDAVSESQDALVASVGPGGNLIDDARLSSEPLASGGVYWQFETDNGWLCDWYAPGDWEYALAGDGEERTVRLLRLAPQGTTGYGRVRSGKIPVSVGDRYCVSVYANGYQSYVTASLAWYASDDSFVSATETSAASGGWAAAQTLDDFERLHAFATAPASAVYARVFLLARPSGSHSTGEARARFVRPMLSRATAGQLQPPEWAPGASPPLFAALQQQGMVYASSTGEGSAGATYTLKLLADDGTGGAQAGFGLSVLKESGSWVADARIRADRFAIIDPTGDPGATPSSGQYPFFVVGGTTYINEAAIGNAAIDTLKLAGNAVTVPQVAVSADDDPLASTQVTLTETAFVYAHAFANAITSVNPAGRGLTLLLSIAVGGVEYVQVEVSVRDGTGNCASTGGGVSLGPGTYTLTCNARFVPAPDGNSGDLVYGSILKNGITVITAKR